MELWVFYGYNINKFKRPSVFWRILTSRKVQTILFKSCAITTNCVLHISHGLCGIRNTEFSNWSYCCSTIFQYAFIHTRCIVSYTLVVLHSFVSTRYLYCLCVLPPMGRHISCCYRICLAWSISHMVYLFMHCFRWLATVNNISMYRVQITSII